MLRPLHCLLVYLKYPAVFHLGSVAVVGPKRLIRIDIVLTTLIDEWLLKPSLKSESNKYADWLIKFCKMDVVLGGHGLRVFPLYEGCKCSLKSENQYSVYKGIPCS